MAQEQPKGKTAYFVFCETHRAAVRDELMSAKEDGAKVRMPAEIGSEQIICAYMLSIQLSANRAQMPALHREKGLPSTNPLILLHSQVSVAEEAKALGQRWKQLTDEQRQQYKDGAC
eukprot:1160858-Pelagomonas_calceolata.AAC.8